MLSYGGHIIYIDLIWLKILERTHQSPHHWHRVWDPLKEDQVDSLKVNQNQMFSPIVLSPGFFWRKSSRFSFENHNYAFHCTYDSNKFLMDFLYNGDCTSLICSVFSSSCLFSFISISFLCGTQYSPDFLQSLQLRYFV